MNIDRDGTLSSVITELSGDIRDAGLLDDELVSITIGCWIAGTSVRGLFKHYPHLFIRSRQGCEINAENLMRFVETLNCGQPVAMVGLSGKISKRSNNARLLNRPRVFKGLADPRSPLAEQCLAISVKEDEREPCRSIDDPHIRQTTLEIARRVLTAHMHQAHGQIRYLYHRCLDETNTLTDFEAAFQAIAAPLVAVAMLADRTTSGPSTIAPRLLEGLRIMAGRAQPGNNEVRKKLSLG
jgi:hypothetical protein